jgi:hypothetical protein
MQLIQSIEEAYANAARFQLVSKRHGSIAFQNVGKYFHWYYFPEGKIFAPSKFIGYKGTSVSGYKSEGTGTDTTRVLNRYFQKIERPSQTFDNLLEDLANWLRSMSVDVSSKTLRGTGGIYLPKDSLFLATKENARAQAEQFIEGEKFEVTLSRSERNPTARLRCLEIHGVSCLACGLDFESKYGFLGAGFIHVHHLNPLSTINGAYAVDPSRDLIPLCPNCHSMIHRLKGDQSLAALKTHITDP